MKKHLIYLTVFILCLAGVLAVFAIQGARQRPHIGVLQWTEQVAPFRQIRQGILASLSSLGPGKGNDILLTVHNAEQNRKKGREAIEDFSRQGVDLLVTIGTRATLIAMETAPETPLVYTLVADPEAAGIIDDFSGSDRNITGITMRVPALYQFQAVRKVLPNLSRLGIFYCTETLPAVSTAKEAAFGAQSVGWQVSTVHLDARMLTSLEKPLARLATGVDAIYIPADPILNMPTQMRRITSVTDALGVPVIGVDGDLAKKGFALMAVHCNFFETGKQIKNPVEKILNGMSAGAIPSQNPQLQEISINLKQARKLNIPIHRNAILMADNIYE